MVTSGHPGSGQFRGPEQMQTGVMQPGAEPDPNSFAGLMAEYGNREVTFRGVTLSLHMLVQLCPLTAAEKGLSATPDAEEGVSKEGRFRDLAIGALFDSGHRVEDRFLGRIT